MAFLVIQDHSSKRILDVRLSCLTGLMSGKGDGTVDLVYLNEVDLNHNHTLHSDKEDSFLEGLSNSARICSQE